jgi:hypothetical protein
MEEAQFAALAWEDMGQAGLKMGSKFNVGLYSYQMKNRVREFYADKVDVAHTGNSEPEERQTSDIELARRIAFVLGEAMQRKQQDWL